MTPTFAEASSRCDLIVGHGETSGVVAKASFESSRLDHFSPWANGRMTGSSRQVDVYASLGSRPFNVSRHLSPCYAYRTTRRITVLSEEALTAIFEIANRLGSPEVFERVLRAIAPITADGSWLLAHERLRRCAGCSRSVHRCLTESASCEAPTRDIVTSEVRCESFSSRSVCECGFCFTALHSSLRSQFMRGGVQDYIKYVAVSTHTSVHACKHAGTQACEHAGTHAHTHRHFTHTCDRHACIIRCPFL